MIKHRSCCILSRGNQDKDVWRKQYLLLLFTILKEKPSNDDLLDGTKSYVIKPLINTMNASMFKAENS
jgi:hypothetical protein